MTVLFIPKASFFSAAVAAGSGNVIRWTYTCPAGKRAELIQSFIQIVANGNAANTTQAQIQCTLAGVVSRILFLDASGAANSQAAQAQGQVSLQAGDTVTGASINNGAAGVVMVITCVVREYQ